MSLKTIIQINWEKFKNDTVFLNRFAKRDDEYLDVFTENLRNNEIPMRGNNKKVYYEDFSKIDYLGPEINHPEWVQQLNRFYWIKYCAVEYEKNKSDHMAKLVYDAINAWMEYWPYYGDRSDIFDYMCCDLFHPMISTPLRLGTAPGHGWIGCLPYFFDHPLFTEEWVSKVTESVLWQIKPMIENNRIHLKQEGNWRPNELSSLLFLSQVLPGAEKYTEYTVMHLNDAFYAQYEDDGVHIEHTTDYHDWMTDIFAMAYILSLKRPELGLNISAEKILMSMDYGIISKAPDGRQFGIHDSYSWHPDNPIESPHNLMVREYIAQKAGRKSFEEEYYGKESFIYNSTQQYFFTNTGTGLQTGTGPVQKLFFDASKWGNWHMHQSKNSLNFFFGNKMLLIDPGSLDYGNSAERWYGKLTPAHNTVSINNLSQCLVSDPQIREYYADKNLVFMISDYTGGYQDWSMIENKRPVQGHYGDRSQITGAHERIFFWIKGKFILVFDSINLNENIDKNVISCHWQFLKGDVIHNELEQSAYTCFEDYNIMIKKIYSNTETKSKIYCGNKNPLLGYNSRTGGKLSGITPAPMLAIESETDKDMIRIGQIIIPFEGTGLPNFSVNVEKTRYAILFKIKINDETYDIASHYFVRDYFKTNSAIRDIAGYSSMARAFVKSYSNGNSIIDWEYKNSKNI